MKSEFARKVLERVASCGYANEEELALSAAKAALELASDKIGTEDACGGHHYCVHGEDARDTLLSLAIMLDGAEHETGCPRAQFWDAGEMDAPCTCAFR